MDNIPEREQPKPERIISFGQDFSPFDISNTKETQTELGVILTSYIIQS